MNLCPPGQEKAGCWVVKTPVTLESSYLQGEREFLAAGRDDGGRHGVSGLDISVHLFRNACTSCSVPLHGSSSGAFGDIKTAENLTKAQTHVPSSQCPQKLDTFPGTVRLVEVFLPAGLPSCHAEDPQTQGKDSSLQALPRNCHINLVPAISSQSLEVNLKRQRSQSKGRAFSVWGSHRILGPLASQNVWPECHSTLFPAAVSFCILVPHPGSTSTVKRASHSSVICLSLPIAWLRT